MQGATEYNQLGRRKTEHKRNLTADAQMQELAITNSIHKNAMTPDKQDIKTEENKTLLEA